MVLYCSPPHGLLIQTIRKISLILSILNLTFKIKIISHLLAQLNHFPIAHTGASKIMSSVSETSDQNFESEEFNASIFEQSNIQVTSSLTLTLNYKYDNNNEYNLF